MADEGISTHQELLLTLIKRIENEEIPWYSLQGGVSLRLWALLSILGLAFSLASSLIAASVDRNMFADWAKYLLIILPIASSGVTGLMQIFRLREKEALREAGRIEADDIVMSAKSLALSATNEDEYRRAYHSVRSRFIALEISQHRGDVALRVEPTSPEAKEPTGDA